DLFKQKGFDEISFGEANVLAQAKNISVDTLNNIGAVISGKGIVSLRDRDEMKILDENKQLNREWLKTLVDGKCVWLWVQSLVKIFKALGIDGGAQLLANFDGEVESLKNLAYLLYDICDNKNWSREGNGYNEIVMEWQDILNTRAEYTQQKSDKPEQMTLF
ncbi:MAG: hypothetical protein IKN27_10765, partial [Selenomonadaceae bacterium]|nr:hypothetical protein [Selenomonadaceae bacterium]